jgi:hypothetical protein
MTNQRRTPIELIAGVAEWINTVATERFVCQLGGTTEFGQNGTLRLKALFCIACKEPF